MKQTGEEVKLLFLKDAEPLYWTPERLNYPSGWWGHVPFAFWIIVTCKPRLLVELGTHHGVSYAAFCEAVARSRLDTRCYAVDTWEGDAHAGFYADNVYNDLKAFHDNRYASFSELLRMTFDEACGVFEDSTVDLLHIDGYHTYEAVRHDFEIWRPKLSERAVVLFHDTNVRSNDFGVWRFFAELREVLPTFEFLHCHGLGVAAVGPKAPLAVRELCELDAEVISLFRERFAYFGARWMVDWELKSLKADLTVSRDSQARAVADQEEKVAWARSLDRELSDLRDAHARTVAGHEAKVAWAKSEHIRLTDQLSDTQRRLELLLASRSWRLTRPLRFAARLVQGNWRAVRARDRQG